MTRGLWDRETVALLMLAAYLPLAGFWLWYGGAEALARLGLAALVLGIWHMIFMLARAQRMADNIPWVRGVDSPPDDDI